MQSDGFNVIGQLYTAPGLRNLRTSSGNMSDVILSLGAPTNNLKLHRLNNITNLRVPIALIRT